MSVHLLHVNTSSSTFVHVHIILLSDLINNCTRLQQDIYFKLISHQLNITKKNGFVPGGGGVKTWPCLSVSNRSAHKKIHPVTIYLILKTFICMYPVSKGGESFATERWSPVLVRTDSLFCCVSPYIHKNLLRPARTVASLVPRSRAWHKRGLWTRAGKQPCDKRSSRPVAN